MKQSVIGKGLLVLVVVLLLAIPGISSAKGRSPDIFSYYDEQRLSCPEHLVVSSYRFLEIQEGIDLEDWLIYTDPLYGISIEYPKGWSVVSPTGKGIGETISFHSPNDNSFKIEVGLYLSEHNPDISLEDWTNLYDAVSHTASGFESSDISIRSTELVKSRDVIIPNPDKPELKRSATPVSCSLGKNLRG